MTDEGARERRLPRLPPLHPFLFALYPIALLYASNAGEANGGEVVLPAAVALVASAVVYGVLRLVLGDTNRAALATSLVVVLVSTFGYVHPLVAHVLSANRLLVVWGLVLVAGLGLAAFMASGLAARLSRGLNVLATLLLAVTLVPLAVSSGGSLLRGGPGASPTGSISPAASGGPGSTAAGRDIVYIVVEDLGRPDILEQRYGISPAESVDWLRQLGFSVADGAITNYGKTALMLASTLNMTYLDDLADRVGHDSGDYHPLFSMINDNGVARFLKSAGYRYVHIGSWWDPTETSSIADVNYGIDAGADDFTTALYETTILPRATAILRRLGLPIPEAASALSKPDVQYQAGLESFDRLMQIEHRDQPTFTFAHVMLPHPPYVFAADGRRLTQAERKAGTVRTLFAGQARYMFSRLREVMTRLVSLPDAIRPIVIVQTDEGPNPDGFRLRFDWHEASRDQIKLKFDILSAFFLPGIADPSVPRDLSAVNTFRLVLSRYFGADLPLLPDRLILHRDHFHPYDFVDGTDRVGG